VAGAEKGAVQVVEGEDPVEQVLLSMHAPPREGRRTRRSSCPPAGSAAVSIRHASRTSHARDMSPVIPLAQAPPP
jgi:hypothetical protein